MGITRIRKRDGRIVPFDQERITNAVWKAVLAVGGRDFDKVKTLSEKVVAIMDQKQESDPNRVFAVEDIQDAVEKVLVENGHYKTAKAYILYREQHKKLRDIKEMFFDSDKIINDYIRENDWMVNENANVNYSYAGLFMHAAGTMISYYVLNNVYPKEVSTAHIDGDFHIHDLTMNLQGYCAGWSLRQLLLEGFNGVPGRTESGPSKHLGTALGQMVNFLGTLQNEWAGAQAFSSVDTYLAPFVRHDKLTYDEVRQEVQQFLFSINTTSRWGGQCVSDDTEALTENGWKKHDELQKGEKIATFNTKSGKIEYMVPEKVSVYDFDGEMISLKNRVQDQMVTPNHRVLRKKFSAEDYDFTDAVDLSKFKTPVLVPITASSPSKREISDDQIRLYAWLVSEGCFSDDRSRISLYQSTANEDNCIELRDTLGNLGMTWHECQRIHGFSEIPGIRFRLNQEESRQLREHISSKEIPDMVKTLSPRQIKLFIDTYAKGDGHIEPKGRMRLYTKSDKIRDQLQELCVLCGYGTTISRNPNNVWIINIIRNSETAITTIKKVAYKGKVWCPTTRNGTFVARRNGKVFITGNSPFTNLTFDWTIPDDLAKDSVIIGGKLNGNTYADYQKEMDMVNRAFLETMLEGDAKGRVFTFPIPTYSITKDFNWDNGNNELLFEMTAKFGLPYFQNFVNSDLRPSDTRAMCCRLQLNLKDLKKKTGGLFGFGESTGSMGVVTINMPRIGFLSRNDAEFFENLERLMYLAKESLEIKRKVVQRNIDNNLLPYTKRYLGTLNHHFSTIGLIGMHEACLNFLNQGIETREGKEFSIKVLKFMRDKLTEYQEETGNIYNLEATPGEGTAYRLARLDRKKYPKMVSSGKREPYYTNSSNLPVNHTNDIFSALKHQDDLQTLYTGGTIFHGFIGEKISNDTSRNLVQKIVRSFRLPYFTLTPTFSVCATHGYIAGEHFNCPNCNARTEVYSRVVGYYRPVNNWNKGKQEEYRDREEYIVNGKPRANVNSPV